MGLLGRQRTTPGGGAQRPGSMGTLASAPILFVVAAAASAASPLPPPPPPQVEFAAPPGAASSLQLPNAAPPLGAASKRVKRARRKQSRCSAEVVRALATQMLTGHRLSAPPALAKLCRQAGATGARKPVAILVAQALALEAPDLEGTALWVARQAIVNGYRRGSGGNPQFRQARILGVARAAIRGGS
jgi:hypothetical protein